MNDVVLNNSDDINITDENLKNASALLALLHGKSDSICRLFHKEILVSKNDLAALNNAMIAKLTLHSVNSITTTIDINFANKQIVTFKSWSDFVAYDFNSINSSTKSIFIQWDFFISLIGYKVPQRHTVSVRISSNPNPSDFFKVLLSGAFDESHNMDVQSSTMICKVDFINNTLAEELVNVASNWNDSCENALSTKGKIRPVLYKYRNAFANVFEVCFTASCMALLAIILKIVTSVTAIVVSRSFVMYFIIMVLPLLLAIKLIAHRFGKYLYDHFEDLLETHIFKISKGDEKVLKQIDKISNFHNELILFIVNTLMSIALSIVFFILEKKL